MNRKKRFTVAEFLLLKLTKVKRGGGRFFFFIFLSFSFLGENGCLSNSELNGHYVVFREEIQTLEYNIFLSFPFQD